MKFLEALVAIAILARIGLTILKLDSISIANTDYQINLIKQSVEANNMMMLSKYWSINTSGDFSWYIIQTITGYIISPTKTKYFLSCQKKTFNISWFVLTGQFCQINNLYTTFTIK